MRNEDSKSKDGSSDSINVDFAVTLSKLIEENEKLKRRVDVLEETFKDKLATLERENDTLQKHLSAMISLTENELRRERSESKKEPRRSGSRARIEHPNDDRRPQHRTSQYCKRFKSSNEKFPSSNRYRENNTSSHEGRSISNRYKSRDDRHSGSYTKSSNSFNHEGRSSSSRYDSRDDRHSSRSIQESHSRCSSEKRKRIHSPKEEKIEPSVISLPSSQEITLWSSTGEMHIKKIYSTPMKFISFPDYKLISPLPNTPDQLKEKFKDLGNKIAPVPLLMNENPVFDKNESIRISGKKDIQIESALKHINEENTKQVSEVQTQKDNVEVQTVMKTDDVEHGVFKRKRRT